ncbi:MAG: DsbA family oxidoreductase [Bacteroidia bacterium]
MRVDIWSDIRCPFCYIGKRHFERALEKFKHKGEVQITWHSFELDPHMQTQKDISVIDYLAERKGISREQSVKLHDRVTQMAKDAGLNYNFDTAVMANSFDAHRLIQLANTKGKGDEAEEQIFKAYFIDGKDISDKFVLTTIGVTLGLDEHTVKTMLNGDAFAEDVRKDEAMAQQIGVSGVPFFVIDQKLGVSGAQPPEVFLGALEKAWQNKAVA